MFWAVNLAGGAGIFPYRNCRIKMDRISPFSVRTMQTFVLTSKVIKFLSEFSDIFAGFHVSAGIAKKTPMIVIGEANGQTYVAHYLPPIIEKGPEGTYLLDGHTVVIWLEKLV
ncbi:MAG: hypothetical protein WCX70_00580 [Candidatus Paceibacterota bacterium]|jgi:hypothetical protein